MHKDIKEAPMLKPTSNLLRFVVENVYILGSVLQFVNNMVDVSISMDC